MTVAAHGPPAAAADLDQAIQALRSAGHRVSAARRELLEALFRADGPQSAERLARPAEAEADLASVYRNLELFERLGLVRHVHLGHGPGLYATGERAEREYMICERCGRLRSFAPAELAELKQLVRERYRFEVGFGHFPLAGLCDRCAAERGPERDDHRTTERHPMGEHQHEHEHEHGHAHAHEHSHDGESHTHAHTDHDHDHVEHEHEHSHGDLVHSHPHPHQPGLEDDHTHDHGEDERAPRE